MRESKDHEPNLNLTGISVSTFIQYYNNNIPETFPQASLDTLEKFRASYPGLFKESGQWIVDKHRKKLMDWLASHNENKNVE